MEWEVGQVEREESTNTTGQACDSARAAAPKQLSLCVPGRVALAGGLAARLPAVDHG